MSVSCFLSNTTVKFEDARLHGKYVLLKLNIVLSLVLCIINMRRVTAGVILGAVGLVLGPWPWILSIRQPYPTGVGALTVKALRVFLLTMGEKSGDYPQGFNNYLPPRRQPSHLQSV